MPAAPPPDRGDHPGRQPQALNVVRGGAVCNAQEKGGHVMKGTMGAAVCMPTIGTDPRPRWRAAGKAPNKPSRHSTHWAQHR